MTNHPRRQRGEDDPQPEPSALEAIEQAVRESPTVQELRDQLNPEPPAHTANGESDAFKPNAATLIGNAVGKRVADAIAAQLPPALAQVLAQVPIALRQWFKCATCVAARVAWCAAHQDDLKAAEAAMIACAGQWPEGDPRRGQLNPLMFLPGHLQAGPGMLPPGSPACPNVLDGIVMAGGTVYCPDHVPGAIEAAGTGRKEFLIAHAPLSAGLIAEVMGQAGKPA